MLRSLVSLAAVLLLTMQVAAIQIRTGSAPATNGFLGILVDDFGSYDFFGATGDDQFNPAGAIGVESPTFTSGTFVFVGGTQRELLSSSAPWQNTGPTSTGPNFGADASLTSAITSPGVGSDLVGGDGVIDTSDSSFTVTGGATNLSFRLLQQVSPVAVGTSAVLGQEYTITNNGAAPINFTLVRAHDGDLGWPSTGNFFFDDEVGTQTNGSGGPLHVYIQNPANPNVTAITLSSAQANAYYGGKNGVDPPPAGGPTHGFGTDVQVWDAAGIPQDWGNFIPGVGTNVNGNSGPAPPGSNASPDAFIGLAFDVQLAPGASTSVLICHTYGSNVPASCAIVPEPASLVLVLSALGSLGLLRRR